ncbi:hypothetical protein Q9R38_26205 [Priestia aryabhattai]|uniref:hypothetical protein n=1 Tax=Priestia aryabhattai TaxID=412384 RepID=UPI0028817D78|nr:hypothetical protein [Priestia aryabhattai]MDT0150038.1 hypothetical protein [Priestia aryabhattai]MDT0155608.1 hypothetical protein [Priestia aryabhattai]
MKLLTAERKETVYTIEFTEREINTLVAAMGRTNSPQRAELADIYGVKILDMSESQVLYSKLKDQFLKK